MTMRQDVVLIIEDNPDDVRLLTRAFGKVRTDVPLRFAEDGEKAISYLCDQPQFRGENVFPVLILLDLKLPRRSGFEVLARIKPDPVLRRVPVVILTSSEDRTDVARAYDLGANSYLVKPVKPDALRHLVAQINDYWLGLNEPVSWLDTSSSPP